MAALALAGVLGPVLFVALVVLQGVLQRDYSHVAMPISALAVWPFGWLQSLNFYVFGTLLIAFALGLHAHLRSRGAGRLTGLLLALSGAGIVFAGVFPLMSDGAGGVQQTPGHTVASVVAFLSSGCGLAVIARRLRRDPLWQDLATYTFACGVAVVVMFLTVGPLAIADGAPLHAWGGLLQRIILAVWFPCLMVLGLRLHRVQRAAKKAPIRRRSPVI